MERNTPAPRSDLFDVVPEVNDRNRLLKYNAQQSFQTAVRSSADEIAIMDAWKATSA